jgi:hypothetical protein
MNRRRIERLIEEIKPESSPTITAVTVSVDGVLRSVLYSNGVCKAASEMDAAERVKIKGLLEDNSEANLGPAFKLYIGTGPDDL